MSSFKYPEEYREAMEAVKSRVDVHHDLLDNWIYLFLNNKKYDVEETVAKLLRRDAMEKEVFSQYKMTPFLRESMTAGIVQYVGRDKEGRPVLYFNTARDTPTADQREERTANLDMFLSWAVRCDKKNPDSTVTWLINQKDASMMKNTDLIFQKNMALRISKFYPGVVAKMYICNMGSALTFVMKPLLRQLPAAISDCIFIYSESDIRKGKLLEFIDADVLPVAMGGRNDCDNPQNHQRFLATVEAYFDRCIAALREGTSIKEMEMMAAYHVDKRGQPLEQKQPQQGTSSGGGGGTGATSGVGGRRAAESEEDLLDAAVTATSESRIVVNHEDEKSFVVSSTIRPRVSSIGRGADAFVTVPSFSHAEASAIGSPLTAAASAPLLRELSYFNSNASMAMTAKDAAAFITSLAAHQRQDELPQLQLDMVEGLSFTPSLSRLRLSAHERDVLLRDTTRFLCFCVELAPLARRLVQEAVVGLLGGARLESLQAQRAAVQACAFHVLDLFPQTHRVLRMPMLQLWATPGAGEGLGSSARRVFGHAVSLDCTSPDNLLLAAQGAAIEFIDECNQVRENDAVKRKVLDHLTAVWAGDMADGAAVQAMLRERIHNTWAQLVPQLQQYIEAKVALSIADFLQQYGLLVPNGRIDTSSSWYSTLFAGIVQFRELKRQNWLFHIFPPLFREGASASATNAMDDGPPTVEELVASSGRPLTLTAVASVILLVEESLRGTREQVTMQAAAKISSYAVVEQYLEETHAKMYIPYASQKEGDSPEAFTQDQWDHMQCYLEAAEGLARAFLYDLAALYVLEQLPDATSRAAGMGGLAMRRRENAEVVRGAMRSRRLALAFVKTAYDHQGTFGDDSLAPLEVGNALPDGYVLGLELLNVVAYLKNAEEEEEAVVKSGNVSDADHTTGSSSPAPDGGVHGVNIPYCLRVIKSLNEAGGPLSKMKRRCMC